MSRIWSILNLSSVSFAWIVLHISRKEDTLISTLFANLILKLKKFCNFTLTYIGTDISNNLKILKKIAFFSTILIYHVNRSSDYIIAYKDKYLPPHD